MLRFLICIVFGVFSIAFAVIAQDYRPVTTITQEKPLFPDLVIAGPSEHNLISDFDFVEVDSVALRHGFNYVLASWGVISPKKEISLSVKDDYKDVIEVISWTFDKNYYFPDKQFPDDAIRVIAWHSFPAILEVKFTNEPDIRTYSGWVNVD